MDPDRSPALRHPHRSNRAHLQFPSTSWDLLADAALHGDRSATARDEFAERYYAAVRAFIAATTRNPVDAEDLTQRFSRPWSFPVGC